jgi:transcriptional regulator with XRE-family HTH domain
VVRLRVARPAGREDSPGERTNLARAFVDEVTWYMSEHKISRADLAQSMGVSPGRVSQILSAEENLTLRTLSGVVDALGVELEVSLHSIDRHATDETSADEPAELSGEDV